MESFKALHYNHIQTLQNIVDNENIHTENSLREYLVTHQDPDKQDTYQFELTIAQNIIDLCSGDLSQLPKLRSELEKSLDTAIKAMVHEKILEQEQRIDGRKLDEIRPITCQIDVLPRVHGSSLFTRGETQVLNILTLGSMRDAQTIDEMEDFEEITKRYLHHYNFPSYSVGETGRYTGPGRREIGHGALAEKALLPVLPSQDQFPYTMRLVSECLGSNGSTSMASTCASSLSLMAGGVPIKDVVAGIAMGLVLDQTSGDFKVLTDIQGAEDHHGDMDFKVTGTASGITAIQLDNKVAGLTPNILKQALIKAKAGRLFIINKILEAIELPRPEISAYAPRVLTTTIPQDKIGDVIGPSGKIIKGLIAKYDVDIDIEDNTGKTLIYGKDSQKTQQALNQILQIIKEFEIGEVVAGKIYRIETYGAFVKIIEEGQETGKEGLIHISNLSDKRVNKVEDVVKLGDIVKAKIIEIKDNGQMSLAVVL
jgi:polyribonucleotide nucleotidyltransferase